VTSASRTNPFRVAIREGAQMVRSRKRKDRAARFANIYTEPGLTLARRAEVLDFIHIIEL
jgi:hypothetical protein